MSLILVVEDDDAIRGNIVRLLNLEGFETASAADGLAGLAQARRRAPELIISDVNMPGMDGFALLAAVRGDAALATIPFLLLTALDDRASMRRGMTTGADDYLSKPFTRNELLESVNALLRKSARVETRIATGLAALEARLRNAFADHIGGEKNDAFTVEAPADDAARQVLEATVLVSTIHNFTSLAEKLDAGEVSELLTEYSGRSCQPVLTNGGRHLKFVGDGLMAVFADTLSESPLSASRRAVSAGLAMALAAHEFRAWLVQRFPGRGLPDFAVGVGLHCGPITLCRMGTADSHDMLPVGDTVSLAARLEAVTRERGWTVLTSEAVLAGAGPGIQTGTRDALAVPGKQLTLDVVEITGLQTQLDDKIHGMASLTERAAEVSAAVRTNSDITARAVKDALQAKLAALKDLRFEAGTEPVRLKGYRITRKIGSGGMTEVYLAERESDGLPIVLKVLDSSGKEASEHLVRFIQEYALLSQIKHPHVITIHDQGFSDDHAYIAMEYFERGDLRAELDSGMTRERALAVARQLALALAAIHGHGIVHRDIKPENVMLRSDGTVALADFGIAKSMLQAESLGLTQTRHGDVVGTPYYMSPEQVSGKAVTVQSDLYSLGVMFFEMLAGRRPFVGDSLESLLAKHLHAATPPLPAAHADLQDLVNQLMAKEAAQRYPTANALLADLARHS
ncbi:MAG: protein kinase [Polaromonas sp.]|nr:protein kinase [Polaromonas sp.]